MKEKDSSRSSAYQQTERETSKTGISVLNRTQKNSPPNEGDLRGLPRISQECAEAVNRRYGGIPVSEGLVKLGLIEVV